MINSILRYNQRRFHELECDDEKGWMHVPLHLLRRGPVRSLIREALNPPVKGDEKLDVKCVDGADLNFLMKRYLILTACHESLINGFDDSKVCSDRLGFVFN